MKIGLIVPSLGRADLLREFLCTVGVQSRLPEEVVLSVQNSDDIPDLSPFKFPIRVIYGASGGCMQRNRGMAYLHSKVDIVVFLDDDFHMSSFYLENLERVFFMDSTIAGVTGEVIADGARSTGYSIEEARRLIAQREKDARPPRSIRNVATAYGCNMAFRSRCIDSLQFDEHLPLYGWLEDVDFSAQVRRRGRLVWTDAVWGIHLGTKASKVSGLRFGYSQVINPLYISKKGHMSKKWAAAMVLRSIMANVVKSIAPEPYIDRRGRLLGNLVALRSLLAGRLRPEAVLEL